MPTTMCIYSETRQSNGEWVADQARTFRRASDSGRHYMECVSHPADYRLFNLLARGAAGGSQEESPWDFEPRGMPADPSPEVALVHASEAGTIHHVTHLTLAELMDRSMVLLLEATAEAWTVQSQLLLLIRKLVTAKAEELPYENRRIVAWFSN